jgi:hypothetical protein
MQDKLTAPWRSAAPWKQVTGWRDVRPTLPAGTPPLAVTLGACNGYAGTPPSHHRRGSAQPDPRYRPRRDQRMAGVPGRPARRQRQEPRQVHHAADAGARPRAPGRTARAPQQRLHQHHRAGVRALVPRRRAHRAPDPGVHSLERRSDGQQGQPQGAGGWRAHRHLPERGKPVRGRVQPLLPRQGPPRRRRPCLHPGPRLAWDLRPRVPGGAAEHRTTRCVPAGGLARSGQRVVLLSASAADAALLGVPDGLDGHRRHQLDLPGAVQPLPAQSRHQGHLRPAHLGLPG